jgi:ABC-type uncharacterized transport system auxiliary subunit
MATSLQTMRPPLGRYHVALAVSLAVLLSACSTNEPTADDAIAFEHVTVVDVVDGAITADQTVVIRGNRIAAVGLSEQIEVPWRRALMMRPSRELPLSARYVAGYVANAV